MELSGGIPDDIDITRPSAARVFDYFLGRANLDGDKQTGVLQVDVREPDRIVAEAVDLGLVDLSEPLAVVLAGVLHFIPDADDPVDIAARLRAATGPGSFLLISHATQDGQPPEVLEAQRLSARTDTDINLRTRDRIREFFGDFTLVDPGLVFLTQWRPEPDAEVEEHPEQVGAFGGVARR